MSAFNSTVVTEKGQTLLAKVIAGDVDLDFTNIKLGADILTGDLISRTSIGTVNQTSAVSSVVRQSDTTVKVSASFTNTDLTEGYYVRTIGLYATDPQDGEILYSITTADESTATADWMPAVDGVGTASIGVCVGITVSNSENVIVEVDPTATATVSQIENLQDQIDSLSVFAGYSEDTIYGVEVDFENKTITRLAGAKNLTAGEDFDDILPFGGRKRCIVTDEGKVLAYYGDTGYTDGGKLLTSITVDDVEYPVGTTVQVMVEQPKYYSKRVIVSAKKASSGRGNQGSVVRYYVSPTAKTGFKPNPIFKDDSGIYQDYIYLSAYEGSIWDTSESEYLLENEQIADFTASTGDKLSSIGGAQPATGSSQNTLTRATARVLANNRGVGWRLHNIFALTISQELMLIEYAMLEAQSAVGFGFAPYSHDDPINTGGTASLGNISGSAEISASSLSNAVTYRGEENLWGNVWTWLDGINLKCDGLHRAYVKANGVMEDNTATGYTELGFRVIATSATAPSAFGVAEESGTGEDLLMVPAEGSSVHQPFLSDYVYCSPDTTGWTAPVFGGSSNYGASCGMWCFILRSSPYQHSSEFGCRLLYVPQTT